MLLESIKIFRSKVRNQNHFNNLLSKKLKLKEKFAY